MLLKTGNCEIKKEELNKVVYESDDIKMVNIRKRRRHVDGRQGSSKTKKRASREW